MPSDDIKRLYEKAEAELKAKRAIRQDTLVDAAVPPPAAGSAPRPPAVVPRPTPKQKVLPPPELDSHPVSSGAVIPGASDPPPPAALPSTYPESEAPTRVDGKKRRRAPEPAASSLRTPLRPEDQRRAKASREWDPPSWVVAIAKWVAPPVMLCLMAVAYWFQAKVALVNEQAEALSSERKRKDAEHAALVKQYAESQAKLGIAQAERDAAVAQAAREKALCSQGALKIVTEDTR